MEAHLQELLAANCDAIAPGLVLVRREYPTDIGPVDLLCRDADGRAVAIEIKRRGEIDGVEQLARYLEFLERDPACARCGACSWPSRSSRRPGPGRPPRIACVEVDYDALRGWTPGTCGCSERAGDQAKVTLPASRTTRPSGPRSGTRPRRRR